MFQQLVILKQFKEKGSTELSDDDIKKVLTLAPDVIDDDFLEDLPEELFKQKYDAFLWLLYFLLQNSFKLI